MKVLCFAVLWALSCLAFVLWLASGTVTNDDINHAEMSPEQMAAITIGHGNVKLEEKK